MNPDLQTVAHLVSVTDQWEQTGTPPQDLLAQALPVFASTLPATRGLRLWLDDTDGLQVAGSAGDMPRGKPQVPHGEALQASHARFDKRNARWTVPLRREERLIGALEIMMADGTERDPQSVTMLDIVASLWGSALEKRAVIGQAQRRAVISTGLTACRSFTDIAGVLAKHLLRSGQRLVINLIRHDPTGAFAGLHTVAAASRSQVHALDIHIDITPEEMGQTIYRAIQDNEIVLIDDVQTDPGIGPRLKMWREDEPIIASCVIPLRSQGRVLGLLSVNTVRGGLHYTSFEWQLLHTLADQIGGMSNGLLLARQAEQNLHNFERLAHSRALVNQITGQMQQQQDMASILELTVSELGRALGARRARIRLAMPDTIAQPATPHPHPEDEAER